MVNVDFKEIALRYEKELKENCLPFGLSILKIKSTADISAASIGTDLFMTLTSLFGFRDAKFGC